MIDFGDGVVACWVAYTQQLIGHKIVDIAIDHGEIVWIFDNYLTIPLTGWVGNKSSQTFDDADTHLRIMEGGVLLDVVWDVEESQGQLTVGELDEESKEEEYWWGITIQNL